MHTLKALKELAVKLHAAQSVAEMNNLNTVSEVIDYISHNTDIDEYRAPLIVTIDAEHSTADKTNAQINVAAKAGRYVICVFGNTAYPMMQVGSDFAYFGYRKDDDNYTLITIEHDVVTIEES